MRESPNTEPTETTSRDARAPEGMAARGLLALAAAALVAALASSSTATALEVKTTEVGAPPPPPPAPTRNRPSVPLGLPPLLALTSDNPLSSLSLAPEKKKKKTLVKLRGSPATYTTYFVEVTTSETSTYDEVSIVDDANLVLPSFVSYFDLPARGKNGDASGGSNETDAADEEEDTDYIVVFEPYSDDADENATEAEDEASRRQQQQEGSEEEDASEAVLLVDGVDLHWLQEQVDLLSRFESSLSLDSVLHRGGILPPRGAHKRGDCHHRRAAAAQRQEDEAEMEAARAHASAVADFFLRGVPGPFSSAAAMPSSSSSSAEGAIYHPNARVGGQAEGRTGAAHHHESVVIFIIVAILYCAIIFGVIYMTLLVVQGVFTLLWRCCCGGGHDDAAADDYEPLLGEEDLEEEERAEDPEDPREDGVEYVKNPLVRTMEDVDDGGN